MAPFRDALGGEVLACPTAGGTLQVELAPHHVALVIEDLQIVFARGTVTVTRALRRGLRRVVRPIGARLVVARGLPSEGVGLWLEERPGEVERVFGVEPHDLYAADGLWALRQLDRLSRRLGQALSGLGHGVRSALEIGPAGDRGVDKVLVADHGDHLTVFRRSLFRRRARRVLDAFADGRVVLPTPRGDTTIACRSRFAVQVIGDFVRFTTPAGDDLARIGLPWLSREDREELVTRIGAMVERWPPPPRRALPSALGVAVDDHGDAHRNAGGEPAPTGP
jgi:hypothetical protein